MSHMTSRTSNDNIDMVMFLFYNLYINCIRTSQSLDCAFVGTENNAKKALQAAILLSLLDSVNN